MIHYQLECTDGHSFDGWFKSSDAFDKQIARKLITCPECGTRKVAKSIMAPSIATRREPRPVSVTNHDKPDDKVAAARRELAAAMRKLRAAVEANSEYVGPRFAEEARKIHYGEVDEKGIYGEATPAEVKELHEEGIPCHPLPSLPEDNN